MTVLGSIGATEHLVAAAAAVGLAVLAVLIARRFVGTGRQFAQPAVVFAAVWGVSLGLFAIPWVRYIGSPVKTYVAVYGSITLFLAGAAAAYRLVPSPAPPADSDETLVPGRIRILWVICLVLGLIGFAFYVRAVNAVVGWHAFFDNLGLVRGIQTTSARFDDLYGPWRLLTYVDLVAVLVWTIGLRSKAFSGRWRFVAPLGVLSILPFAFTGERTLLTTLVVWGVLFHITWRPTGIRRLLTVGVAILAVLVVAFSVIGGRVNKTLATHPEIAAVLENDAPHKIALQYVYITANIPTLTRLMEDPIAPHTHGAMTALPLVKVVHAGGVGGVPPEEVGAFYPIPFETFNNLSWLGTFYLDFGLAGCLILPLLLGFAATAATQIAFRRRTVLRTWLASLVLYVVAFSPLLNKLSTTLTWEYAALGPVVVPFMRVDGYARIRQRPAWLRAGRWQARSARPRWSSLESRS